MSTRSTATPKVSFGQELSREFPGRSQEHGSLRPYTTIGTGGVADYIIVAQNVEDLVKGAKLAISRQVPYRVVGWGSSVLVSDSGYPGLVIVNQASRLVFENDSSRVIADSGLEVDRLINLAAARGLGGIEYLVGLPGTIGGAVATSTGHGESGLLGLVGDCAIFMPAALEKPIPPSLIRSLPVPKKASANSEKALSQSREGEIVSLKLGRFSRGTLERAFLTPETPYQPIMLTIRLQLSQVKPEEIIARLKAARQKQGLPTGAYLSFLPPIDPKLVRALSVAAKKLKKGNCYWDSAYPNILRNKKQQTSSEGIRIQLEEMRRAIEETGEKKFAEKVTYLGYWPNGDVEA